jgi:hypothetical protein
MPFHQPYNPLQNSFADFIAACGITVNITQEVRDFAAEEA